MTAPPRSRVDSAYLRRAELQIQVPDGDNVLHSEDVSQH
jgi:hypothetical protein